MWWRKEPRVWGRPLSQLNLDLTGMLPQLGTELVVRPAWGHDHYRIEAVRRDNREWLSPWEATLPVGSAERLPGLVGYRQRMEQQMVAGDALSMIIEADHQAAGTVSLGAVQHGAMSLANLGYWIAEEWSGRGIVTLAAAAVADLALGELGLHRIEVNVRPENAPSLAVCRRLGLRYEGLRTRYMNINGQWRDHHSYAVDQEMLRSGPLAGGLVNALMRNTPQRPPQ